MKKWTQAESFLLSAMESFQAWRFAILLAFVCLTEYLLLLYPSKLPFLYSGLLLPLLLYRFFLYQRYSWSLYMLETCYWVNLLLILYIIFAFICTSSSSKSNDYNAAKENLNNLEIGREEEFPLFNIDSCENLSAIFIPILFGLTNGPLAFAIIIYSNKFSLLNLDKFTSFYIHLMPNLVMFTIRWCSVESFYPQYCGNFYDNINPFLLTKLNTSSSSSSSSESNDDNDSKLLLLSADEIKSRCHQSGDYLWFGILVFLLHEMLYNWFVFGFCQAHTDRYEKYKSSKFSYTYFRDKVLRVENKKIDDDEDDPQHRDFLYKILLRTSKQMNKIASYVSWRVVSPRSRTRLAKKINRNQVFPNEELLSVNNNNEDHNSDDVIKGPHTPDQVEHGEGEISLVSSAIISSSALTSASTPSCSFPSPVDRVHQWICHHFVTVYILCRVFFTSLLFLPTILFYNYYYLHLLFLLIILLQGAYSEGKFQLYQETKKRKEKKRRLSLEAVEKVNQQQNKKQQQQTSKCL